MARRRKRGSLKKISAANLKKMLQAETKSDLVKMILALEGVTVRKRGKKRGPKKSRRGPGRPRKAGRRRSPGRPRKSGSRRTRRGSFARTARRDRLGRILPKSGRRGGKRGPGRPRKRSPGRPRKVGRASSKRRSSKRGSYAKTGARYTNGPMKGKLMPRNHAVSSATLYGISGLKQPKRSVASLERSGGNYWSTGE